jgi:hypothetical protein
MWTLDSLRTAFTHDIARGVTIGQRNEYALNTVLWAFHRLLRLEDEHGIAILDQLRPQERYVVSRLNSDGLKMVDGRTVPLPRLTGIATAHVEWSHCLGVFSELSHHTLSGASGGLPRG